MVRPRFGYERIWVVLRREGWAINRKRVHRLYRLEGLQVRMRVRRRKHMGAAPWASAGPAGPTERWSMDFVLCPRRARRWAAVLRPHGRRSVESSESDARGGR